MEYEAKEFPDIHLRTSTGPTTHIQKTVQIPNNIASSFR